MGGSARTGNWLPTPNSGGLEEPPLTINPHLDRPPGMDRMECMLARVFLRRYVTYCARRRRYAEMQGAALLRREVSEALRVTPL